MSINSNQLIFTIFSYYILDHNMQMISFVANIVCFSSSKMSFGSSNSSYSELSKNQNRTKKPNKLMLLVTDLILVKMLIHNM